MNNWVGKPLGYVILSLFKHNSVPEFDEVQKRNSQKAIISEGMKAASLKGALITGKTAKEKEQYKDNYREGCAKRLGKSEDDS